ncbi:NAD-dependent protein deacetylase sirtuin-2 isoform X2 [Odontomachus brunneus]|nr:NAD-dependent protein deacetylase sirtuin-2 isoform X2 [Odontomachus brunneus]
MERLRKFLTQKLRLIDSSNNDQDDESQQRVLRELSLDGIVEYIKEHENCKIITMAGAGISTSAGIPDFRSPSSGLYHKLDKYNLPHPQAIFELDFFIKNPEPFFTLARELLPEGFKPTVSHYFIRLLWEKGLLLRHYTQNIDTLERVAGLPADKLVEAHGTFHTGRCLKCRAPYTLSWMKEKIIEGVIPKCEECEEGVVKPDIVFFGEMLPERFHLLTGRDFAQADLLIIMGSSLVVQPFASLIDRVRPNCPRLLINNEKVGMQDRLSRFLGLRQGLVFDSRSTHSGRDIAWLGDCDTGCQLLADKLGWGDELRALVQREHESLSTENRNEK